MNEAGGAHARSAFFFRTYLDILHEPRLAAHRVDARRTPKSMVGAMDEAGNAAANDARLNPQGK
jgi:hypothetical protein